MADNAKTTQGGGVSFMTLLFAVFLVLKLTHVISWSWWWITAPLWAPSAVFLVLAGFLATLAAVANGGRR